MKQELVALGSSARKYLTAQTRIISGGPHPIFLRILDSLCKGFRRRMTSPFTPLGERRREAGGVPMFTTSGSFRAHFIGSAVALDPRHNVFHSSLGDIGRICHRDQLRAGASQDRTGMMLGMAAGAKERNAKRTRV